MTSSLWSFFLSLKHLSTIKIENSTRGERESHKSLSPVLMNILINQFAFEMIKYPGSQIRYARYADYFMGAIKRPQRQTAESFISKILG